MRNLKLQLKIIRRTETERIHSQLSTLHSPLVQGQIPEWPNGADCKSAGLRLRWFESIFAHDQSDNFGKNAEVAQLIEH